MSLQAGEKYGKLTVLHRVFGARYLKPYYICLCDCGQTTIAKGSLIKSGNTKSCGCGRTGRPRKELPMTDTIKHEPDCPLTDVPVYQHRGAALTLCTCNASTAKPPQPGAALTEEINRYDLIQTAFQDPDPCSYVGLHPSGKYVLYADHLTAQAEALAVKDAEIADIYSKYVTLFAYETVCKHRDELTTRAEAAEARVKVLEGIEQLAYEYTRIDRADVTLTGAKLREAIGKYRAEAALRGEEG